MDDQTDTGWRRYAQTWNHELDIACDEAPEGTPEGIKHLSPLMSFCSLTSGGANGLDRVRPPL